MQTGAGQLTRSEKMLRNKMFNDLKKKNPKVKTLLSVGGIPTPSVLFSKTVSSDSNILTFAGNVVTFLTEHGLDGMDLAWGGSLLLTATVSPAKSTIDDAYEVEGLAQHLAFINIKTFDFHGTWEPWTGHNSPLYAGPKEVHWYRQLNIDWSARYWQHCGFPAANMNLGLSTYGRAFTLNHPNETGLGASAIQGKAGKYTGENGFLAYYEICPHVANASVKVRIPRMNVPCLVYDHDQWVGYDDARTEKVRYIRIKGHGVALIV
nr:hypothetical protein BaRGS_020800 [Batillaria attramentaria]